MNIVTKLVVMGGLIGLVGCVTTGPKPQDPDPNKPSPVKPVENQIPPTPVARISPDDINEGNANAKALEQYNILLGELTNKPVQVAER